MEDDYIIKFTFRPLFRSSKGFFCEAASRETARNKDMDNLGPTKHCCCISSPCLLSSCTLGRLGVAAQGGLWMLLARQQTAQARSLWALRVSMRGLRWCPWRLSGHTPVPAVSSLSSL